MSGLQQSRRFLFLQGPLSPLYRLLGKQLSSSGNGVVRVNLSFGDWLHWHAPECLSYRGKQENWPDYLRQLIDRGEITTLVMHSDSRWYHQQAVVVAKELGLEVIVTELGLLRPGWLTLEWGGLGKNSDFPSDPEELLLAPRPDPASAKITDHGSFAQMALWDVSYNLLNYFLAFLYPHFTPHTPYNPLREYLAWVPRLLKEKRRVRSSAQALQKLLDDKAEFFVFPLQLSGDFQIRQHSPYESMREAITEVLHSFAYHSAPNHRLLLKQHPLDPGIDKLEQWTWGEAKRLGVEHRVDYIDAGDLNQLLCAARGIVTVNSTVGIEALRLLKPVKVLGEAIYNMPKLTFQGALDQFWHDYHSPDGKYTEGLVRTLIQRNQVRGGIYGKLGLKAAVENIVEEISSR